MAIHIRFEKQRAEAILAALDTGQPVAPANGKAWTVDDTLMLAGVLMRAVCATTPITSEGERLNAEVLEHRSMIVMTDVAGALAYYAKLTEMLTSGTYDAGFESVVEGVLKGSDQSLNFLATAGVKRRDA